jgi:hypothetical protein
MAEKTELLVTIKLFNHGIMITANDTIRVLDDDSIRLLNETSLKSRNMLTNDSLSTSEVLNIGRSIWKVSLAPLNLKVTKDTPVLIEVLTPNDLSPEFEGIPWECMVDPQLDLPIAIHPYFTIFRKTPEFIKPDKSIKLEPHSSPLRIMLLIDDNTAMSEFIGKPNEEQMPLFSLQEHFFAKLTSNLKTRISSGFISIQILHSSTAHSDIRKIFETYKPHVLHLFSEQTYDSATDLDTNLSEFPDEFFDMLKQPPILIRTNQQGGSHKVQTHLGSAFNRYEQLEIQGLIEIQGTGFDKFALKFWTIFYSGLAEGDSISKALKKAGNHLAITDEKNALWLQPIIFTYNPHHILVHPVLSSDTRSLRECIYAEYQDISKSPFKGLISYESEDKGSFFGRESQIKEVIPLLLSQKRLMIYGESGIGKSSCIKAGLIPALEDIGFKVIYLSHYDSWIQDFLNNIEIFSSEDEKSSVNSILSELDKYIETSGSNVLIIFDQAEDLSRISEYRKLLKALFDRSTLQYGYCCVLISIKTESLQWLKGQIEAILYGQNLPEYELTPLTVEKIREILKRLGKVYGFQLEDGLEDRLMKDLCKNENITFESRFVLLPQFSLIMQLLYFRRIHQTEGDLILNKTYDEFEVRKILSEQLEVALLMMNDSEANIGKDILIRMVDTYTGRPVPRTVMELSKMSGSDPLTVEKVLIPFVKRYLIRKLSNGRFEFVHEILSQTVLDEYLPDDFDGIDITYSLIRPYIDKWKSDSELLPVETLRDINKYIGKLKLTNDERALYIASVLIHENEESADTLFSLLDSLSIDEKTQLVEKFRYSDNPTIMALAVLFTNQIPPYLRKGSLIEFKTSKKLEAHARFLSEAALGALSNKAFGIEIAEIPTERKTEDAKTLALELIKETKLSHKPINLLDIKSYQNLLSLLGMTVMSPFGKDFFATKFWPGTWISYTISAFTVLLISIVISHALWPQHTQNFSDLTQVILISLSLLFSCILITMNHTIFNVINYTSKSHQNTFLQKYQYIVTNIVNSCLASLFPVCFYTMLHLLHSLSDWQYNSFFTITTIDNILWIFRDFPENLYSFVINVYQYVQNFYIEMPIVGKYAALAMELIKDASFPAHLALVPIYLIIGMFIMLIWCFVKFFLASIHVFMPGIFLLPTVFIFTLACFVLNKLMFYSYNQNVIKRVLSGALTLCITAIALPYSLKLMQWLLIFVLPYLWRPDIFYGEEWILNLSMIMKQLSQSPITIIGAFFIPVLMPIFVRLIGNRKFRMAFGKLNGESFSKVNELDLRPLISEGTYESLHFALQFVKKQETARGLESFYLAYHLATGLDESMFIHLNSQDRYKLAEEAEEVLCCFPVKYWKVDWHLKDIRQKIENCKDKSQYQRIERIMQVLIKYQQEETSGPSNQQLTPLVEESKIQENNSQPLMKPAKFKLLKKLGIVIFIILMPALIMFPWQLSYYFFTHLLDLLYPLSTEMGTEFLNLEFSIRTLEFFAFLMILFGGWFIIASPFKLYKKWKNPIK